jgi:myo-inositol-1(or 4)-monophosphatase
MSRDKKNNDATTEFDDWVRLFRDIGAAASKKIKELYRTEEAKKQLSVGAGGDITLEIDKAAEDLVISKLKAASPRRDRVRLISEEAGVINFGDAASPRYAIIADPVDGSLNAKEGLPLFAISLALVELQPTSEAIVGNVKVGYVRNLISDDEYWAVRDNGAFWNGKKIEASKSADLRMLGIEFYPELRETVKSSMNVINATERLRSIGSIAIDFCLLAQGYFDAFIDFRNKIRLLDIAAGILLVKEAGGVITDSNGNTLDNLVIDVKNRTGLVVAGNTLLHKKIMELK